LTVGKKKLEVNDMMYLKTEGFVSESSVDAWPMVSMLKIKLKGDENVYRAMNCPRVDVGEFVRVCAETNETPHADEYGKVIVSLEVLDEKANEDNPVKFTYRDHLLFPEMKMAEEKHPEAQVEEPKAQ